MANAEGGSAISRFDDSLKKRIKIEEKLFSF
jgi:hypothetical protein